MTPEEVETFFKRSDGTYLFARWGRPIVPVVFGVEDETVAILKGAVEALCVLTGHKMAETDPELGANLMVFFVRDWDELLETPNLDKLVPELSELVPRLQTAKANQYRFFRFDEDGGIRACFSFVCMDKHLSSIPADTLALNQMVQAVLLWSDKAFQQASPLAMVGETAVLRPEIGDLLRAAYDPIMPVVASDPSHALRLSARMGRMIQ